MKVGDPSPRGPSSARALLVVMLATAVSSDVGFAVGMLGPQLRSDLGISRTALGALPSVFFAATGVASIVASRFVRSLGARRAAAYVLFAEWLVCLVAGLVGSYLPLLVASLVAGAGYAVVNIAGNRVVRSISDDAHLGRFMSVKTAGVPVATTVVAIASGLTTRWGWQPIIVGIGVCAGLAAVAALRVFAPAGPAQGVSRHGSDRLAPSFLLLPVVGFSFIAGTQPLYSWVPTYLHESLDVGAGPASVIFGTATGIGIPAMIGLARLADHIGGAHRARFIGGLCATTALALVLVLLATRIGLAVAVVGIVVAVSASLAIAGLFPALIVEYAPHAIERGTGVAMSGYFFGALASPVGFGALADQSDGYLLPWVTCIGLVAASSVLCLLIHAYARPGPAPTAAPQIQPASDSPTVSSPALDA